MLFSGAEMGRNVQVQVVICVIRNIQVAEK